MTVASMFATLKKLCQNMARESGSEEDLPQNFGLMHSLGPKASPQGLRGSRLEPSRSILRCQLDGWGQTVRVGRVSDL